MIDDALWAGEQILELLGLPQRMAYDAMGVDSGRDVLERLGMSENEEGLDVGDVAGFGVDMALDPWNLIIPGAGMAAGALGGLKAAKYLNRAKGLRGQMDELPDFLRGITDDAMAARPREGLMDTIGGPQSPIEGSLFDNTQMGELAPQGLLEAPIDPFSSGLDRAMEGLQGRGVMGDELLTRLPKMGVRQAELEDRGIIEFLRGKGKVSRGQLDEHLAANPMAQYEKVVAGGQDAGLAYEAALLEDAKNLDLHKYGSPENVPLGGSWEKSFSQHSVHELEDMGMMDKFWREYKDAFGGKPTQMSDIKGSTRDTAWQEYAIPGGEDYQEMALVLKRGETEFGPPGAGGIQRDVSTFTGQHSGFPDDTFAHIRYDTRHTPDGKKVLFINEIQSDWHQAGAKHGYKDPKLIEAHQKLTEQTRLELMAMREKLGPDFVRDVGPTDLPNVLERRVSMGQAGPGEAEMAVRAREILTRQQETMRASGIHGVPDAPLKKDWDTLAFKEMVDKATKEGYDYVALAPGQMIADVVSGGDNPGLVKFMDEVLPSKINKALKRDKHGKLEKIGIKGELFGNTISATNRRATEAHSYDLAMEFGDAYKKVQREHGPDTSNWPDNVKEWVFGLQRKAREYDTQYLHGHKSAGISPKTTYALRITPDIKKSISRKGQSLYSLAPLAAGGGAAAMAGPDVLSRLQES